MILRCQLFDKWSEEKGAMILSTVNHFDLSLV
jgi:hypothetical protein